MSIRHVDYVTSIAKAANASGFHFGALVFNGRDVISSGWCQSKSHPAQARFMRFAKEYKRNNTFLHAEVHAIISARCDLSGYDMIVARWAEGKVKTSHPCEACWQAMIVSNIRRVWYYDETVGMWVFKKI